MQHVMTNLKKDMANCFKNHYNPTEILTKNTSYKMIISKRSDGKTYAMRLVLYYAFQKYGFTSVIVRRLAESIKKSMIEHDFDKIFLEHPEINFKKYDGVGYYNQSIRGFWFTDETQKKKKYDTPFVEYLSVSNSETTKSSKDYQNLFMVLFDEICSRSKYLPDEFNMWCNLLSTIIRETLDCTVIMLGNPVSFVSPYFSNYGIKPLELPDNSITIYKSEKSQTSIAIEKVGLKNGNKKIKAVNDRFFGFENQKVKSITTGIWETPMYPRLKKQTNEATIYNKLFCKLDECVLRLEMCNEKNIGIFVRVHEFYDTNFYDDDIIIDVSDNPINLKNVFTKMATNIPCNKLLTYYIYLYHQDKYFYSDNMTGETLRIILKKFMSSQPKYI